MLSMRPPFITGRRALAQVFLELFDPKGHCYRKTELSRQVIHHSVRH